MHVLRPFEYTCPSAFFVLDNTLMRTAFRFALPVLGVTLAAEVGYYDLGVS